MPRRNLGHLRLKLSLRLKRSEIFLTKQAVAITSKSTMSNFKVVLPKGSGKACTGWAKTIGIQVIEEVGSGYLVKKIFRFQNGNEESFRKAYKKADAFAKLLSSPK